MSHLPSVFCIVVTIVLLLIMDWCKIDRHVTLMSVDKSPSHINPKHFRFFFVFFLRVFLAGGKYFRSFCYFSFPFLLFLLFGKSFKYKSYTTTSHNELDTEDIQKAKRKSFSEQIKEKPKLFNYVGIFNVIITRSKFCLCKFF